MPPGAPGAAVVSPQGQVAEARLNWWQDLGTRIPLGTISH